jgi:hypothetical protein
LLTEIDEKTFGKRKIGDRFIVDTKRERENNCVCVGQPSPVFHHLRVDFYTRTQQHSRSRRIGLKASQCRSKLLSFLSYRRATRSSSSLVVVNRNQRTVSGKTLTKILLSPLAPSFYFSSGPVYLFFFNLGSWSRFFFLPPFRYIVHQSRHLSTFPVSLVLVFSFPVLSFVQTLRVKKIKIQKT